MKKLFLIPVLMLAFGTAACGNDADPGTRDTGPAQARINFPDHFPTVAHKCYGPNGVYIASNRGTDGVSAPFVLADDKKCNNAG